MRFKVAVFDVDNDSLELFTTYSMAAKYVGKSDETLKSYMKKEKSMVLPGKFVVFDINIHKLQKRNNKNLFKSNG